MKRRIISLLLALCLFSGCAPAAPAGPEQGLTIVATTYPIYILASAVAEGVEDVTVEQLNTGSVSCLHDYTLSVGDMKKLERAGVIAMNGVELEEFMEDALATSDAAVIDCSVGVELLENLTHHHEEGEEEEEDGHDHGHFDPHYWMDPENALLMVENLRAGLTGLDPEHETRYKENAAEISGQLTALELELTGLLAEARAGGWEFDGLITFHDGFQYFANACGIPLLAAIEEEAGSEASAKEIVEISELVKERDIPVIFTEVNGSDATAKAIARETGCRVEQLTMVMSGPDSGFSNYRDGLMNNATALLDGFAGEERVSYEKN